MTRTVFVNDYHADWRRIAASVKEAAGWRCVRCGRPHDPAAGYALTVHHLDGDKANNAWWNTPALCQRCHLSIQSRVVMARPWLLEHSAWFRPYVAGYYAARFGLPDDRDSVLSNLDTLIAMGQGRAE